MEIRASLNTKYQHNFSIFSKNCTEKFADIYVISRNKIIFFVYRFFYNFLFNKCFSSFFSYQIYYINARSIPLEKKEGNYTLELVFDKYIERIKKYFPCVELNIDAALYQELFTVGIFFYQMGFDASFSEKGLLLTNIICERRKNRNEMVKALIDLNTKVNTEALFYAVKNEDIQIISLLLLKEVKVNAEALFYAVKNEDIQIISLLLLKEVNVNQTFDGQTILHQAVEFFQNQEDWDKDYLDTKYQIIELLINSGANVKSINNIGDKTPYDKFTEHYTTSHFSKIDKEYYKKITDLLNPYA